MLFWSVLLLVTSFFQSQRKEEDMLAQKKMPDGQKEEISQVGILLNQEE